MPSRTTYAPLPRSSSDSSPSDLEFKDKPLPRRSLRLLLLPRKPLRYCRPLYLLSLAAILLIFQLLFNNSYSLSSAPSYDASKYSHETVFIAANIINGDLITGAWGRSLLELVDRIGKERVFVSIYGGPKDKLEELAGMLECEKKIVSEEEEPLSLASIPRTTLPTGEKRVKRIAFLAGVRNKVLAPLNEAKGRKWDKILFINDVFFDAEGAERLLWGTGEGYKAICAADFVTSWKYYDTFATRDAEGYSIGVPLYPWFGKGISRNDVLEQRDRVRVKSCWGGMVSFDGRYFQSEGLEGISAEVHPPAEKGEEGRIDGLGVPKLPLRFRSEAEPFWDSSECCLIHADLISLPFFPVSSISSATPPNTNNHLERDGKEKDPYDTGIYMNPYVRTAYSASTYSWLTFAKRFERLFSPLQRIITYFASLPRYNYRRTEKEGELVQDKLWISVHGNMSEEEAISAAQIGSRRIEKGVEKRDTLGTVKGKEFWANEGYYTSFNRTAKRGGYCGVRQLLVLKEEKVGGKGGGGNWDNLLDQVPPVDV